MIVFALYLHVCSTQMTSLRGTGGMRTVTACSQSPAGNPYTTKALCDAAGKARLAQVLQEQPNVDAYECRPITLNSK